MKNIIKAETPVTGKTLTINVNKIIARNNGVQIGLNNPSYASIGEMGITEIKINDALFVLKEKPNATL